MTSKSIFHKIRKIPYALFLGLILFGVLGNLPTSVSAACSGNGCVGKDPITEGCNSDATTKYYRDLGIGRAELRYSPSCGNAKWASGLLASSCPRNR